MTPRPTRSIEPLPPPPGRFDQVLREARSRRYRRATAVTGVAGVFLAGIMGGMLLGGIGRVQNSLIPAAWRGDPTPAETTTSASASARPKDTPSKHTKAPTHRATTKSPASSAPALLAMVRGNVVDPSGGPVAGIYVYTGTNHQGDFVPHELPAARTGETGGFSIPCEGPVLLTPWPLNQPMRDTPETQVAAQLIRAPVCSRVQKPQVMRMAAAGAIEGQVRTDTGCAESDFRMSLWLDGNRATTVKLSHLREGDAFRLTGVPAGKHDLATHGKRVAEVTVADGATVSKNITFLCPELPTPSETPSLTPLPAPTPSETQSPSPSQTPTTTEPSPSPTGTAQSR